MEMYSAAVIAVILFLFFVATYHQVAPNPAVVSAGRRKVRYTRIMNQSPIA